MQCKHCGGLVTWRGPLNALTHTECEGCGATGSQVEEGAEEKPDRVDQAALDVVAAFDAVKAAISDYYADLDARRHGGVAMDRAFRKIEAAMGMTWVPGASQKGQAA